MKHLLFGVAGLSLLSVGAIHAEEVVTSEGTQVQIDAQEDGAAINILGQSLALSILGDPDIAEAMSDVPGTARIVVGNGATVIDISCSDAEACSSVSITTGADEAVDLKIGASD